MGNQLVTRVTESVREGERRESEERARGRALVSESEGQKNKRAFHNDLLPRNSLRVSLLTQT